MTVKIYDSISKKERTVKNIRRKTYEKEGEGVQFTVIGKNREWSLWLPRRVFASSNPHININ